MDSTTLGNYRILEEIGRGSMAVVYRAIQLSLNRPVALKVLEGPLAGNREFVSRFEREARAAARLNHPNITQIYDFGADSGTYYIALEYCPGKTLAELLGNGEPLPRERAGEIVSQIAIALDCAHRARIIHRDVKPANVMVMEKDLVKLMDLGVARPLDEARLTTVEHTVGTFRYMSPEQISGKPCDERSDVYSLGLVAYETATGSLPFRDDVPRHEDGRVSTKTEAQLPRLASPADAQLGTVITRALSPDPSRRFQSAAEFLQAWQGATVASSRSRPGDTLIVPISSSMAVSRPAEESAACNKGHRRFRPPAGRLLNKRMLTVSCVALAAIFAGVFACLPSARVTSNPPGADLVMDGSARGQAPLSISRLMPGMHTVTATKKGYKGARKAVNIPWRSRKEIKLALPLIRGWAKVTSNPPGASVHLDGKPAGETPLYLSSIALGNHIIRLSRNHYEPQEKTLVITGEELRSLEVNLSPRPTELNVESTPSGASILIDGVLAGTSPRTIKGLMAGRHSLELRAPGYEDFRQEIELDSKEALKIQPELAASVGAIQVDSNPGGAQVFLDGMKGGQTPLLLSELKCGDHTLRLEKDGFLPQTLRASVKPGATEQVSLGLTPALGSILILATPPGTEVFLDSQRVGTTESFLSLENIKEGSHEMCFAKSGYYIAKRNVEVRREQTTVVQVALEEDAPKPWQPGKCIYLKNGGILNADILSERNGDLVLKVDGGTITLKRDAVERISTREEALSAKTSGS